MTKQLSPLADLMTIITACACLNMEFISSNECVKKFENVKNALKALEIIKEKTKYFIDFEENTKTIYIDCALDCDAEQFDLLKEVLK